MNKLHTHFFFKKKLTSRDGLPSSVATIRMLASDRQQ